MESLLIGELAEAIARREAVVSATVISSRRSVPRHAGSKMLVYRDGRTSGTIGGGEMEARVITSALEAFRSGTSCVLDFDLLDPTTGDPGVCGGSLSIYLEPFMPVPTVLVIGCGHVGRAVVDLAHWSGLRTAAYDDRPELVTAEVLPNADARLCGDLADALDRAELTEDTYIVLVSRNMKFDLEALPVLLARPAAFIGVMGSNRRWNTTRDSLLAQGVEPSQLDRVHSPIGIELNAETPEEIAVSIIAEIVALRRGAR